MKTNVILLALAMLFCSRLATAQVWNGNLVFTSQAEIDNFGFFSYTAVNGNLEIRDGADNQHDITNLAGLAGLTSVSGSVVVMNNNLLPNTGYLNLTSVGSLHISGNPLLTTINGLPITNEPSAVHIESNNALTAVTAFGSVATIGKLILRGNPLLSNINGFANLAKVTDSLVIAFSNLTQLNALSRLNEAGILVLQNNPLLANINGLTALVKVRELDISYNALLANVNGLTSLASASQIIIYQNPALLNIAGLENVIISDFGAFFIHNNNALQQIVGSAGCVRLGILSIYRNPALTAVSGFNALKNVLALDIVENPVLANVSGFAQLDTVGSTFRFQQNVGLTTINAFTKLRHIRGNYTNINNYVLSSIAPMPLLDSISGSFQLRSDTMLTALNFMPNLRTVGMDMIITSCKGLANVNGLSNLTSIREGSLIIDSCSQLVSLGGLSGLTKIAGAVSLKRIGVANLQGLQNLKKVNSSLSIENNLLLTSLNELISLDTVTSVIGIRSNPLLTNVNGLRNLRRTQGITLGNNASLAQYCGLYPILAGNNPPTVVIGLNLVNPTVQEILNAGPCTSAQLPVTMKLFTARCSGNKVVANWITLNEVNSSHFVLQRSMDGAAWIALGSVAAAGNSGAEQKYHFIDDVPLQNGLYRLAQHDIDGKVHYSAVVKGGCAVQGAVTASPNPVTDRLIVSVQSSVATVGMIRIFDSKGVVVRSKSISLVPGHNKFELAMADLASGLYVVQVQNDNGFRNAMVVKR